MRGTSFIAGLAIWVVAAAVPSVPRPALAVLIVALVLVPQTIVRRGVNGTPIGAGGSKSTPWLFLALAVPLVGAYAIEPSLLAATLAVPWLAGSVALAGAAAVDGLRSLPAILRPASSARLLLDASLVLLAVGALFVVLERADVVLPGLSQMIMLVTAVHFHVLGFGLTSIVAAIAPRRIFARVAAYPLLIGIPITAMGFVLGLSSVQWIGAVLVVSAGLLTVMAMLQSSRELGSWHRVAYVMGAFVLLVGVPLGLLWATQVQFGLVVVDLNAMVAVHGTLNTLGTSVALLAVPGWEP